MALDVPPTGLSVVLLLRNERHSLPDTLHSLEAALPTGRPWQVLVVDGSSTDGSTACAAAWCAARPGWQLLGNPRQTTPWAMAVGLTEARHPYVAFCGAHTLYPPGYFGALADRLDAGDVAAVGGRCQVIAGGEGSWAQALAVASDHWFAVGRAPYRHQRTPGPVQTAMMPLYDRTWLTRIGGIPTDLVRGQDFEINRRIRALGGVLWLLPNQVCQHRARPTVPALVSYRFRTGFWPLYGTRFGGRAFSLRHLLPAGAFSGIATLSALPWPWADTAALLAMAGYTAAASAVGIAAARTSGRPAMAWQVPALIVLGHVAYAVGTLVALLRRGRQVRRPWHPTANQVTA